ncbi:MAG TPA: FtsX-like permease family protein [Gemmataceae bacterium]|jgi:putative ABC transport system permease protein|nr:FtsX-like permease family protein [Gemmataceae bacterium]
MLSLYWSLSLRYWARCRLRCGLILLSIALGAATCVATSVLDANLEKAFRRSATPLAGLADLYVSNGDAGVPASMAEQLAQVPGVRAALPVVIQRVALPDLNYRPALLLGVNLSPDSGPSGWTVTPREFAARDFMHMVVFRQKTALVGQDLEEALPADSDNVRVLVAGQVHSLKRAGVLHARGQSAAPAANMLLLSWSDAAALLGRPDLISRVDLSLEPGADREQVRRRVEAEVAGRARVAAPEQLGCWVEEMLAGLRRGLWLCGVAALAVGLFLVANVLAVSAAERRHDVGILKSLGALPWQIGALFAGEAVLLGLAGSALGLPLGLGLAYLGLSPVQQVLSDAFLPLESGPLEVTPWPLLGAVAAGVCTALLAAALPALQAGRVGPIESLRRLPPPVCSHCRRFRVAACLGLLACGLGYLAVSYLPSRLGGYGAMVLLLLAGLLMTPLLALAAARALQPAARRLLGPSARLALDNLIRSPGRTGLVITTLAAGAALFVQTSGFIASNEKAIEAWVEHSLTGDLFVTSGGPLSVSGQNLPMAPGTLRRLEEVCPEAQVVPIRFRYLDWQRFARPSRVLLCAVDAERYYAANEGRSPPLPDLHLYRRLSEPGTALVSRNFAALYGVRAGDPLTLPGAEGPVVLRVLGTVEDYTCSRGTVIVDRRQYSQQFDAHLIDSFTLYLPPGADVESVRQRLQGSPLGTEQAFCVLTRDALRGHILGMVLGLYRLAYAQEVMVAVVSILAIVTALLLSIMQRRRELGLLRAVGATPAQVVRSVLAEAVFMGMIGTAAGLAVGAPLEWYTVRVLLFAETGTLLPVHFPWAAAGTVFCLMLISAALASLVPALRAGRGRIAEAISWEC